MLFLWTFEKLFSLNYVYLWNRPYSTEKQFLLLGHTHICIHMVFRINLTVCIKGREEIPYKNKSILKDQNISTRLWLGDYSLLKLAALNFHYDLKQLQNYCVLGRSLNNLLDIGHHPAGKMVGIFVNCTFKILIHGITKSVIRKSKIRASDGRNSLTTTDIFWRCGKGSNLTATHMAF